jgi:hypothetical protein
MSRISFIVKQTPSPEVPGDKDDSSYDRTFTEVGESPPTYNENAKFGSATLKFTGNDQKLTTPANSNLNLGTAFTIDFWMRFDPYYVNNGLTANGGAKIISNYEAITAGESTTYNGYEIGLYDYGQGAKVVATYWYNNGLGTSVATLEAASDDALVSDGGWHHICFQRYASGEDTEMALYVDGVRYDTDTNAGTNVHNTVTTTPFTIGARARADVTIEQPFLYGTLDELEIINGVAKFDTAGFTPPTTASTSTANHLLLMHFDSDNPAATVWHDTEDNMYWFGNASNWDGSKWTISSSYMNAQYGWNTNFRPTKMKIVGTVDGGGTFTVENFAEDYTFGSGSISSDPAVSTVNLTFGVDDDIRYLKNMTVFATIISIQCDAKPNEPMPA